jgi:hypothetical protein
LRNVGIVMGRGYLHHCFSHGMPSLLSTSLQAKRSRFVADGRTRVRRHVGRARLVTKLYVRMEVKRLRITVDGSQVM